MDEFLRVFGDLTVSNIMVVVMALGYIIPQAKKGYFWLLGYLNKTESREKAIGQAENLEDYHQQSINIRNGLQRQIDGIKTDIEEIKGYHEESGAVRMGMQALLRDTIVSTYNKYQDKGYMPIYARESLKKIYEAYTDLGGNDVAHDLYEKMRHWDTDPDAEGREE